MSSRTSVLAFISCLLLFAGWTVGLHQSSLQAKPVEWTTERPSKAADSLLLDQYPNAYAAYSLAKQRSDYEGPLLRVRRGSDDAEKDFGPAADGRKLDVSAIESWLSGADGYVATWYNQVDGEPDLQQSTLDDQPYIAKGGTVETDEDGRIAIKFDGGRFTFLTLSSNLTSFNVEESLPYVVGDRVDPDTRQGIFGLANKGNGSTGTLRWTQYENGAFIVRDGVSGNTWADPQDPGFWAMNHEGSTQKLFGNNDVWKTDNIEGSASASGLTVGAWSGGGRGYKGYVTAVGILPSQPDETAVQDVYNAINIVWELGPTDYNADALLPQKKQWQVDLYNWMETLSEADVTLSDGTLSYDYSYDSVDELADLWLKTQGLSASSVTRREPGWYVLDNGNGKGIEATGEIRANHNPKGPGGYGGNPPRSWQNEPAYWYKLDLPLSEGGQGNPWHKDPAMGRRAMVVSIVDMIMHVDNMDSNSSGWFDMVGKAFLGMAEAYRWAGDVMPPDVQEAYEEGMEEILDHLIDIGPRGVNTNMDMFALQGAADFYMATDDTMRKEKCVQLVKRSLFGYTDGELGTKHRVFGAGTGRDGGVFDPSGFIMEGDQPDVFYGGESIIHLAGALSAVTDRSTGDVPEDWTFLEEVIRRLQEWRSYQKFYDPAVKGQGNPNEARTFVTAGAGFSGRTSHGVPKGQGREIYKALVIANRFPNFAYKGWVKSVSSMENGISNVLSTMNSRMSSNYTDGQPQTWSGWSPWTKKTPYLPPEGWYTDLKSLANANDPKFEEPPPARKGEFWNKPLGGPPTGKEYWSYKREDANGEEWGFFVEAQAQQGGYGGWYGGKIETFWTESTGVVLLNRHGKTGCDRSGVDDYSGSEDSTCWFNLDEKAGHHVWGRDENGNGFTTLLLRGRNLSRTANFDTDGSPPTVTVNNVFNDPNGFSDNGGEETGSELEGNVEVENKFEAQSNGLKVTHTLTSDETDQVTELWASLPVYLRHHNPHRGGDEMQDGLEDTSIEYWDGSQWVEVPYDADSDGVPERVSTTALRLGRDYEGLLGQDGPGYVYVDLASTKDVRRSKHKYYDPYQTRTGVRTVHIDLHGDPGTTKTLPAEKSVSYTLQTTDPTAGDTSTSQVIPLQNGWNIASTSVTPTSPAMDSIFAGLQSEITVVKNDAGERYRPGENINEIGEWNSEEAYAVHAKSDVVLSIQGDSLGSASIALEGGWNWVPYFPSSALPVEEALSSIIDDLGRVKDETGRVYLPQKDPDVLEQMEPGEGYKIYVRQSTTLNYPDDEN